MVTVHDDELDREGLYGELRELRGRVVAFEIRDGDGRVLAAGEGEFGELGEDQEAMWFQLGGVEPVERDGLRFISSSHTVVTIPRFVDARRQQGIGAPMLRVLTVSGLGINVWPAMPPREQYTDLHNENR